MMTTDVTERIIRAAMKVHTAIGPGLLEKAYDACLFYELSTEELQFEHQIKVPVSYREVRLDVGFRIDYLVENCVRVELKAVETLLPIHSAQLLSYLKLSGRKVGLGYDPNELIEPLRPLRPLR